MKDEISGQIMEQFVELRGKLYSYLKDNNDKKPKDKKKVS